MLKKYMFLLIGTLAIGVPAAYVIACGCPDLKAQQIDEKILNGQTTVCSGLGSCTFKITAGPPPTWSIECSLATTGCATSYTRTDGHGECTGGTQEGTYCRDVGVDWYDHHFTNGSCKVPGLPLGCNLPTDDGNPTLRGNSYDTSPC